MALSLSCATIMKLRRCSRLSVRAAAIWSLSTQSDAPLKTCSQILTPRRRFDIRLKKLATHTTSKPARKASPLSACLSWLLPFSLLLTPPALSATSPAWLTHRSAPPAARLTAQDLPLDLLIQGVL